MMLQLKWMRVTCNIVDESADKFQNIIYNKYFVPIFEKYVKLKFMCAYVYVNICKCFLAIPIEVKNKLKARKK